MISPLAFIPAVTALQFLILEMPRGLKKKFFALPLWAQGALFSIPIGIIGRGVLGPTTAFMTEILFIPGLYIAKKHFLWQEKRFSKKEKEVKHVS